MEISPSPSYRLYSQGQVLLATFLGSPLAAGWLIAANQKALSKVEAARNSVVLGVIATILLMIASLILPDNFPVMALPLASLFAVQQWYKHLCGVSFQIHMEEKGLKGSWGITVGIAVMCLILIMALLVGIAFLLPENLQSGY